MAGWLGVAGLSALLALGAACQLAVTDPLWLQHLRISPSEIGQNRPIAFAGLAAHALLTACLAFRRRGAIRGLLVPAFAVRLRHWVLGAVIFVACAAHLTRYVDKAQFAALSYAAQLGVTGIFFTLDLLNVLLIAAAAPVEAVRGFRERLAPPSWDGALPWVLAAWTFAASLFLGWVALDQVPHIPDELAYVFQAEGFARGILWGEAPPNPEAFKVYLITSENGRWFAATPPGWPAVLALGSAMGAPWLVNPLLGGLAVLLAHALTRRLLGLKAAHLAAFLMSVSPWLLYLSASYMTHSLSLALMLGAFLCLTKAGAHTGEQEGRSEAATARTAWSLLAGALIGWLALVRQLDAVLVALVAGLWTLGLFGRRLPWAAIVAFGAGFVAIAALILPYNAAMTGNAFEFPINAYLDKLWYPGANRLGFGPDVGNPPGGWGDLDAFPGHGLRDVLINTNQNLYATNFELFGWCIGSLAFAALHAFFGKRSSTDRLMLFWIVALLLGYHLYWFSGGPDFGARYWYLMIYPLVVLTVRGIGTCVDGLRRGAAGESAPERVGVVVGVLTLITLAVFIPWRAVARYQDYRGFHADYRKLEGTLDPRALVFVKTKAGGKTGDPDFSSAVIRNSPRQTDAHPIFAQDLGDDENRKLIAAFPDRPVVYVTGRSMGDGPTRVVSGPASRPR